MDPDTAGLRNWVATKGQVLFCPGLPGARKTFLTSIVINHVQEIHDGEEGFGLAYHCFRFNNESKEGPSTILSNILSQLSQRLGTVPDELGSLYKKHKERGTQPSFEELSNAVFGVTSHHSRVFIIIDGLDECSALDVLEGES